MSLLDTLARLEDDDDLHTGRLLVLLGAFAGRKGDGMVEGLTKLAKLDFLLRYPVYLSRALRARGVSADAVAITEHEHQSVESRMVRFKYGPWDHRYRRFVNILVAKGLARVEVRGRAIHIGLTPEGVKVASTLAKTGAFQDQAARSRLLKSHLDLSATNLMHFVYDTFPEIGSLRLGEEIIS